MSGIHRSGFVLNVSQRYPTQSCRMYCFGSYDLDTACPVDGWKISCGRGEVGSARADGLDALPSPTGRAAEAFQRCHLWGGSCCAVRERESVRLECTGRGFQPDGFVVSLCLRKYLYSAFAWLWTPHHGDGGLSPQVDTKFPCLQKFYAICGHTRCLGTVERVVQ